MNTVLNKLLNWKTKNLEHLFHKEKETKEKETKIDSRKPIIQVEKLSVGFEDATNGKIKKVLRDVDLTIYQGEKISIIGESGSGKTVLSTAISALLGKDARFSGRILVNNYDVTKMKEYQIRQKKLRGEYVSYVFQNPLQTLNPYIQIGTQLIETILYKKGNWSVNAAKKKVLDLLRELKLINPEIIYNSYPHQLSGGMIQRIVIACSILLEPKVLILDEPTSALDAVVELQIIELLNQIAKRGTTIILISHDLNLVSSFSNRIAVMYAGKIVEVGTVKEINLHPQHPYTWGLLMAVPKYGRELYSIPGRVPTSLNNLVGDAFAPRNFNYAMAIDFEHAPPMFEVSPTHIAATWLLDKKAPNYTPPFEIQQLWMQFDRKYKKIFEQKVEVKV